MPIFVMWSRMVARMQMPSLTPVEREAITDSVLKIQSVRSSLSQVEETKIPGMDKIDACLSSVHKTFRTHCKRARLVRRPPGADPCSSIGSNTDSVLSKEWRELYGQLVKLVVPPWNW